MIKMKNVCLLGFLLLLLAISIGFATGNFSIDDSDDENWAYVDANHPIPNDYCYWDYYLEDFVEDKEDGMEWFVGEYRHDENYLNDYETVNFENDSDSFRYYLFLFDEYNESYHGLNSHAEEYRFCLENFNEADEEMISKLEDLDFLIDYQYGKHVEKYDELNGIYSANFTGNVTFIHDGETHLQVIE